MAKVEKFVDKSGIYAIINLINKKNYVGSAVSFSKRWGTHINQLRNNKHHNKYLQRAWNKYGEDNFEFSIIEIVEDTSMLLEKEQYWIDRLRVCDNEFGYNSLAIAGSPHGYKHSKETKIKMSQSQTGRKHSDETKKKLSEAKSKENLSEETLSKYSEIHRGEGSPNSKLTELDVIEIKKSLSNKVPRKDLAIRFNVAIKTIDKIATGETWEWLEVEGFVKSTKKVNKVTDEQISKIKELLNSSKLSNVKIAKLVGVSRVTVDRIKNGERHK